MTVTDPVPTPTLAPAMPAGRRRLTLAVLATAFALWIAALLAMYFTTVYPARHPRTVPAAVAPDRR